MQGKIWGRTKELLGHPLTSIHELNIKPNSYCSWHKHNYKWNWFYCLAGTLVIEVRKNDYELTDETVLMAGEFTTVKPGEVHRFRTDEEPAVALEGYHPEVLSDDIERESVGGSAA